MSQSWLYRYEIKGIQAYVLAESRLRQIKGGSALIEDIGEKLLNDALAASHKTRTGQPPQRVVIAAGGGTIRFFSKEQLDDFSAHWPMIVQSWAPGVHIIHAWVSDGQHWYNELQRKLQQDRQRLFVEMPEAGPLVQRSPRSGLPAVVLPESLEKFAVREGQRWFDNRAVAQLAAGAPEGKDPVAQKLWPEERKRFRYDTEDIAEKSYIAVVHADGNDLGRMFMQMFEQSDPPASTDDMAKVSTALSRATAHAARDAFQMLEDALSPEEKKKGIPGRPIVIGGDDMTALVRADLSMGFTQVYLTQFEEYTRTELAAIKKLPGMERFRLPDVLTACAGVAVIQPSYPFHAALGMSEDLCKFCKTQTRDLLERKHGRQTPSSLAFYRITTGMSDSYTDLLKRDGELCAASATRESGDFLLTAGPYLLQPCEGYPTVDDLKTLYDAANKLPNGALRQAVQSMKTDLRSADERLSRLRSVMEDQKKGKEWGAFSQAMQRLGCLSLAEILSESFTGIGASAKRTGVPLWREHRDPRQDAKGADPSKLSASKTYTTPLLDALTWLRIQPVSTKQS